MMGVIKFSFKLLGNIFFKLYCPLRVQGLGNLPAPPYILSSNHCSHLDTLILMFTVGLDSDLFAAIAANDYFFEHRRWCLLRKIMNIIPVNRHSPFGLKSLITECNKHLSRKRGVFVIYPEGTRSQFGQMLDFKRGVLKIAAELNIPIVPVGIQGSYQVLAKGRILPKPGPIIVSIGKPIIIYQKTRPHYNAALVSLQQEIMNLNRAYI